MITLRGITTLRPVAAEKFGEELAPRRHEYHFGSGAVSNSMLYFLFGKPGSSIPLDTPADALLFFYHKKSGMKAILWALLMAAVVEIAVLHYFLLMWSPLAAWIATLSTLWVAMTIIAQIRAVKCRPIYLHDETVFIRNGMYQLTEIPLSAIKNVHIANKTPDTNDNQEKPLTCSFPVGHNVVIFLNRNLKATLLYAQRREFDTALIFVDEPQQFLAATIHND